jgi:hypothetical protein
MTDFNLPPLHALEIVVGPHLKGSKRAVRFGTEARVHVSPAMYDLIRHANAEELKALMGAIEIVNLPPLPSIYDPLPMTTEPPPAPDVDRMIRRAVMFGLS